MTDDEHRKKSSTSQLVLAFVVFIGLLYFVANGAVEPGVTGNAVLQLSELSTDYVVGLLIFVAAFAVVAVTIIRHHYPHKPVRKKNR